MVPPLRSRCASDGPTEQPGPPEQRFWCRARTKRLFGASAAHSRPPGHAFLFVGPPAAPPLATRAKQPIQQPRLLRAFAGDLAVSGLGRGGALRRLRALAFGLRRRRERLCLW